jgi:hypothetical protein
VNNYVEKRGLDTPDAAIDAAFNNLPIGKAAPIAPKIKGLHASPACASGLHTKLTLKNLCA